MKPIPPKVRKAVLARDDDACVLCGRPADHLHHVKSRGAGGKHEASNLVALCVDDHLWAHAHPAEARERFTEVLATKAR